VSAAIDPTGVRTETAYDAQGNPVRVTVDPAGKNLRTCFRYDGAGNMVGQTDPRAATCP
jgi:YD repeat-containing protein